MPFQTGYVALLDVLGFSAMLGGDDYQQKLGAYQQALQQVVMSQQSEKVEAIAFSDSIVLTTAFESERSLLALIKSCALIFRQFLDNGIAIRGAISYGNYSRETVEPAVFVAGRPIVDAYNYEKEQGWVGIMLTPAVVARQPDLAKKTSLAIKLDSGRKASLVGEFAWATSLQPCEEIPIAVKGSYDKYSGYAVVPHSGDAINSPLLVTKDIVASIKCLQRLKGVAPTPPIQDKYNRAINWLDRVRQEWHLIHASHGGVWSADS